MKTDLFQSCVHCWVFPICWHIECSTFTASSFRIWNSSTGIPSPPLALFIVILPKAHLTSHSMMSDSTWVITPSWLSGWWRSFLDSSSVYSCHLFLTSSASYCLYSNSTGWSIFYDHGKPGGWWAHRRAGECDPTEEHSWWVTRATTFHSCPCNSFFFGSPHPALSLFWPADMGMDGVIREDTAQTVQIWRKQESKENFKKSIKMQNLKESMLIIINLPL